MSENDFFIKLDVFEGPFDLLLQLISKHKLDVTEVALSAVTDEFISTVLAAEKEWDLEKTSSFLVVAATLLDLKTARLLPSGDVEDEEDLAVLEARDLLFSRLLQYRAFKEVSSWMSERLTVEANRSPRVGAVEPEYRSLLPEVKITTSLARFAALAAKVLASNQPKQITLDHLHAAKVSVAEQGQLIVARLKVSKVVTFKNLTANADRLTTVARFLALLELYRQQLVTFEQLTPLGELTIRWAENNDAQVEIFDEYELQPPLAQTEPALENVDTATQQKAEDSDE